MPYIKKARRKQLDKLIDHLTFLTESDGEVNYVITRILLNEVDYAEPSYGRYNAAIGVLECAKLEFYRRAVADYEDEKIKENGDVYDG